MPSSMHTLYSEKKIVTKFRALVGGGLRGALDPQNLGDWRTEKKDR